MTRTTIPRGATSPAEGEDVSRSGLAQKMAGSAAMLTVRRLLITTVSAAGAAVVARFLGPGQFGPFVSALAIYGFALALVDLGFSLYLAREMARNPEQRSRLLAATVQVQLVWAATVAVAVAALGFAIGGTRGDILLVASPALLVAGLNSYRQVYFVLYRLRSLMWIDVPVNLTQVGLMVTAAALGAPVTVIAATFALGSIVNTLLVARAAHRILPPAGADASARRTLVRRSTGLGIPSLMATVYFSLDLVALGWLVDEVELGLYAAAVKVLSILILMPGLVMSAVLPGLSSEADHSANLGRLATRVWHWLVVIGMPAAVGIGLFAPQVIDVAFGAEYADAVGPLRVLCLAMVFVLLSNLTGMLMVSKHLVRPQLVQNSVAIVVSLAGILVLVPRHGIVAAAWMTLIAELIVVVGGLFALRHSISYGPLLRVSLRPLAVIGLASAAAVAVHATSALGAMLVYFLVLVGGAFMLRAWPDEFSMRPLLRRRLTGQQA